ncbi:MAG TPA: hypothetical protein VKG81_16705 [Mycobacterium sp.]|nr:hypothetical protein [Mycobacterium sp.]
MNRPHRIAVVLPALAAACRYEPRPGSWKEREPDTNCSEAIRKNQPPAQLIMLFQIRPIMDDGTSRVTKRRHGRSRAMVEASCRSTGWVFAEW